MAADRERVIARLTEALNLVLPGTYSVNISPRNKTRNEDALEDVVDEAGVTICQAIVERPNEYRSAWVFDEAVTVSGNPMPEHVGPPLRVLIEPYDGGTPVEGKHKSWEQVQSWRENIEGVYDDIDHDAEGSTLSGYWSLWNDHFYFTGHSATLTLVRPVVRTDVQYIPDFLESTWVKLAIGNAAKVGTGAYETSLIAAYGNMGMADLESFKNGQRQFAEVELTPPVHQVSK